MKNIEEMKAVDFMTSPVITVNIRDTVHDIATLFIDKNISGAIVLDDSGKDIGVITKTDLARYDRERLNLLTSEKDTKLVTDSTRESLGGKSGFHMEAEEETIESWFNPAVYSVSPDASLVKVTNEILKRGVHHLFVRETSGKIVGIITTLDLVGCLSHALLRIKAEA